MKKRVFSALLALVLALSAVVLPASAAESFSDVSDKKTAQNVEVLRLLGVVEGNGAGQFNPSGLLTRAEFCKMVVVLMGKGDDAMRYKTVTIFPDVRATHWAAGYVNLAVRQSEPKLLAGLPDGTFQPDSYITYGQAVTILMRVLGFADKDSGGIWPDGYINLAKSTGVSAGVNLTGSASITRAQAAQLFVNVLSTGKDGKGYTPAGCTKGEEVTLVSMNGDKLRISGEKDPKTLVRPSSSSALNGLKGYLLTNSDGKVVTFVPKTSSTTGAAVSNAAVILSADKSTSGISALTDGRTDYTVYRNGVLSSVSALRKNDVVTYDAVSNTVYACDTRVTVYYESCEPSPSAPVSIKVLGGTSFDVLPTAQQSLSNFKPGKTMTLLLTNDGAVAGAVENDYSARGNAIGIVDSEGNVKLLCGSTTIDLVLEDVKPDMTNLKGKLVSISSSSKTSVGLYAKTGGVSGDLNVREGTLGSKKLASGVMLFDDGVLKNLSDLTETTVPQSRISYARTNANGEIDLIVLIGTGDELYGRVTGVGKRTVYDATFGDYEQQQIAIDSGDGKPVTKDSSYSVRSGDFVSYKIANDVYTDVTTLDKLGEVSASAWIGTTAVNYGGRTYTVPSDVLCWNRDGGSWLDGGAEAAIAYGGTMNLYVRDGVVRVIEVRG